MEEILQDSRFAHIVKDPRFRRIPKHERKVKIDKRFQSMFKDERFKVKYTIDKRGRPANTSSAEDLKRYYDISSSDDASDSESEEEDKSTREKLMKTKQGKRKNAVNHIKGHDALNKTIDEPDRYLKQHEEHDEISSVDENAELSDHVNLSDNIKDKLHDMTIDYARGEGVLLSDSSSGDDSDSEGASDGSEDVEHDWGELDKDADTTQEATHRIAICNMDWDRVRAQDLLVLLSSFLPKTGGAVKRVTIYPSEFGMQRMKEEEVKGPIELCDGKTANSDEEGSTVEDSEDDEGEEGRRYHMEKLRRYQLNRLRYFYAIAECDSTATAEHVYNECDGLEYESSATKLDLRFVPHDIKFDQEPRDSCNSLPEPGKYAPKLFTNTALQQAKVELTWDETDPQRVEVARKLQTAKNIDEIDDADLRAYLASSGSDDEEPDDQPKTEEDELSSDEEEQSKNGDALSQYKLLLEEAERQEQAKKKKDVQMEVTWGLGLKEKTEKLVKERLKSGGSQATPFEEMLAKKREKRRQRREERKKLNQRQQQEENEGDAPFSDDEIPSDIDMNDPYFKEELKDTVPKESNKKKRKWKDSAGDENEEEKRRKAELELLMLEDGGEESKKHFSLKSIQEAESGSKKKRKKKKLGKKLKKEDQLENAEDDFQVNVNDERFSALFSSHHYSIDPTDPHYKQTKGMEALRKAKLEKRHQKDDGVQVKLHQTSSKQKDTALSQLVKSVKMKTRGLVK